MSMQMSSGTPWRIPEFSLGDRLRKARESADLSQTELADQIGVSRRSLVRYEGEGKAPRSAILLYAMRTNVPAEWIMTGRAPSDPVGPAGIEPTTSTVKAPRLVVGNFGGAPRLRELEKAS